MKDERFVIAGNGLKLMFIGTILGMLSFIPVIGGILAIVGWVISLVGLAKTTGAAPGYKNAIIMLVVQIVVSIIAGVMASMALGGAILGSGAAAVGGLAGVTILSIVSQVLAFLQTYFICTATSGLLREIGAEDVAVKGDMVWKLNALCYLIAIVVLILTMIVAPLAAVLDVVSVIVSLVADVLFVICLYQSQRVMLA